MTGWFFGVVLSGLALPGVALAGVLPAIAPVLSTNGDPPAAAAPPGLPARARNPGPGPTASTGIAPWCDCTAIAKSPW